MHKIEVIKEYKYLAIILTPPQLSMNTHFKGKQIKVQYAIKNSRKYFINSNLIPVSEKFELFNATMRAIMGYSGQIWGHQEYEILDKYHSFFIKRLLELP